MFLITTAIEVIILASISHYAEWDFQIVMLIYLLASINQISGRINR